MSQNTNFLHKVPMFANLTQADLEQLCRLVEDVRLQPGEVLFEQGSLGSEAYVIKEGQVGIYVESGGRVMEIAVRHSGEVIGEISLVDSGPRTATVRALSEAVLIRIDHNHLDRLLDASPSIARNILHTVIARLRSNEMLLQHGNKMAQLGTFTAGITHELNNPASAIDRSSKQLRQTLERAHGLQMQLDALQLDHTQLQVLTEYLGKATQRGSAFPELNSLATSDREAEMETWLEDIGLENGWEWAPSLVNLDFQRSDLERLSAAMPEEHLYLVIDWLSCIYTIYTLLEEISRSTVQITDIVRAFKTYTYLDQSPVKEVDVREGLENTLIILRHKLKYGVEVHLESPPDLPRIQAYASELNQVWTNIIDNAIEAMQGKGEISIRVEQREMWVVVTIEDNGPGISPEVQDKLFSPFFTTKEAGRGTGLGLSISYSIVQKHGGDINVESQPGKTRFEIWLPLDFETQRIGTQLAPLHVKDDMKLQQILENVQTIAVVGISDKPNRPNYDVPEYLQKHGYRIIPVNPNISETLGEKAYPDLLSVPEPFDTVLIFRPSEYTPPIVDQAVQAGARTVWMQAGIFNKAAAQKATQAGLQVVMDTCMRETHKRLVASE